MEPPRVNPVGILESPDEPEGAGPGPGPGIPRRFSRGLRFLALALLAVFLAATVGSSVLSFGAYCLTTDGGDTRALPGGLRPARSAPVPGSHPLPSSHRPLRSHRPLG